MPPDLSLASVRAWRSSAFELVGAPETYAISQDSDGPGWEYSDAAIEELLPMEFEGEFLFAITNVPLTDNYYGRRLSGNRAVVTLHEVADIMRAANIPLENAILRLLYSATLVYRRFKKALPATAVNIPFTHDETRGCLFDMTGFKADLAVSCDRPVICADCVSQLQNQQVPFEVVDAVQKELRRIKKPLYYRMIEWVQRHPVTALVLSAGTALTLGIIGSLVASYIYAALSAVPAKP